MNPCTGDCCVQPDASPRVTVIIVNWNGRDYLSACLQALLVQTMPNFRVVLVDNASTDGSLDGVDGLDPRLVVERLGANLGFAQANNLAVRLHAQTEYIALLNPDAFPAPDWLGALLSAADAHPEAVAFGSRLLDAADAQRLDGTGDVYHAAGIAWRRRHGDRIQPGDDIADEIFAPCAAAALYRLAAWREVGGFDASYFCYYEDVDLGFRLRLRGYVCRYVPTAICRHVGSGLTGRRSDFATYHGHRNLLWTFVKNMPGPLLTVLLPAHLTLTLASLLLLWRRGQAAVVWRAKRDALLALPRVLEQRRAVQRARKVGLRTLAGSLLWWPRLGPSA